MFQDDWNSNLAEIKTKSIFEDDQIVIIGTVKDAAPLLAKNVLNLNKVLGSVQKTWFLVESNSQDETLSVLTSLSKKVSNFNFLSLGNSDESRLTAITKARQACYSWVLEQDSIITKVLVVDLDQDYLWSEVRFRTSLENFDALFCHQNPYYDTLAFMDILGMTSLPNDWASPLWLSKLLNFFWFSPRLQIRLGSIDKPLQVRSAFGGMAVYTKAAFESGNYSGSSLDRLNSDGVCEHITFNQSISLDFNALWIEPSFRAPVRNEHSPFANLHKLFVKKNT